MPKKLRLELTGGQSAALYAGLAAPGMSTRQRQRLLMVRDAANGDDVSKIAFYRRADVQTVRRWLEAFRAGGVAALADRPRSGHPPATPLRGYPAADWAALEGQLAAGATGERTWTLRQLVEWLARERGVRISAARLGWHLRERRFRWERTKRSIQHKADPATQARKAADLGTLQAFARAGAAGLVYVDAAGFAPTCPRLHLGPPGGRGRWPPTRRRSSGGSMCSGPTRPSARRPGTRARVSSTRRAPASSPPRSSWTSSGGRWAAWPPRWASCRPASCAPGPAAWCGTTAASTPAGWSGTTAPPWPPPASSQASTYSPYLNLIDALWRQITYHELPVRRYTELAALLAAVIQARERHVTDPSVTPKNFRKCA